MLASAPKAGVLVYQPVDESGDSHRRLADAGCRVTVAAATGGLADRVRLHEGPVHALLGASLRPDRLDANWLAAFPELRIVAKYTIGVDDIDVDAATSLGILVTHCPTEANWGGVAEGTIALMLALLKKIESRSAFVKSGGWRNDALRGTYLGAREDGYSGITIGIVGFGRIGRRVAELMAPWKVRVLAADPYVESSVFERYSVEPAPLESLLGRSDVVTLHCSLTDDTKGLIGRDMLARMRPQSILINTARGEVVDVDAVCDALDSRKLAGVALDVLPEEPPQPGSRILDTDDRVILSPHMIAANQGGTLQAAIPWATDAVLMALKGVVPPNVYNEQAIDAWCARFAGESLLPENASPRDCDPNYGGRS